jgi:hypothetical protein
VRRAWAWLALLVSALTLGGVAQNPTQAVSRRTGTFKNPRLDESSGVVASRRHPGLLWTMNDSGGDPVLFLTDTTGAALGVYPVRGASNVDWEALGRGPCGNRECLVIGDTGDNGERRSSVTLYRMPEPDTGAVARRAGTGAESLTLRYPDRPHDVEALYVEPDGAIVLITKGRRGGVVTFRVPAEAWGTRRVVTPAEADRLPIPASMMTGRVVTDAAIAPDGRHVAVRTYRDVYFFLRGSDGHLRVDPNRPVCDIAGREPQGEGLDFLDRDTLVLTSERATFPAGIITLLHCPGQ